MQGIGTGRLIAGRYDLQERRAHQGDLEVWLAFDTTARQAVSVTVFPLSMPRADAALDAARRAAGVDDHRLLKVLDVGNDDTIGWIVEESLAKSTTLTQLLQDGPLEPEQARLIAGEVASALDVAARRGLHHLHITPYAVRRTTDGRIKLAGLATAAAIEGTEEVSAEQAELEDTVGVLAVTYAALTSRWPRDTTMPGLAAAPRIVGGVAAPSEIAGAVPADLDLICRTVLNGHAGPRTPGELASQIAPWRHEDTDTEPMPRVVGPPTSRKDTIGFSTAAAGVAVSPAAADEVTTPIPVVATEHGNATEAPVAAPVEAAPVAAPAAAGASSASAASAAAAPTVASDPSAAVPGGAYASGPSIGDRMGNLIKTASAKAESLRERRAAQRAEVRGHEVDAGQRVLLDDALRAGPSAPLPPPTPLLASPTGVRDGEQSRLALAIVAGFLVLALAIALPALFRNPAAHTAVTPAPSQAATAPSARARPAAVNIPIQSSTGFDPQGDGTENGGQAPLSYDGDATTMWTSEGYRGSATMGGTKEGVGVIYTLPPGRNVTSALLSLTNKAQDLTVYVSAERSLDNAQELGKLTDATGQQTVRSAQALSGRYVIVWFTKAGADGDKYRCALAEVSFS